MILSEVSVKRPVFTTVMMLALMVFGIWSYSKVGVDQFPEVEFPVVTVMAVYPGADPESVETKVVDIIEEAVNSVSGIEELTSTSSENVGIVVVRFELSRDADQAVQDVRDKVASVIGELPVDLEAPVIQKMDLGAAPIMSLVVSAPMSTRDLTNLADKTLKQRLQTIQGVGNIDIVGGQEREFEILVDPVRLQSFGIAVEDVARAIGAQNIAIPGGRLEFEGLEYSLKTQGEVHTAEELGQLVVANANGRDILVSDVANVIDGVEEKRSHASLNGVTAVSLTIQKQSGANTVEVAERVRTALDDMKSDLGEDVVISIPVDNSVYIKQSIDSVQFDLVFGGILAILIIMLFLRDWRATFIAALALPISVIATVAFIYAMGFTFNTMTMLALTLSIGILIDDAIVVIENIHRHLNMGKTPTQAALDGTAEIGLAVLAITASIVAVFVPVATMQGIIGRFFYQFGLTVAFAVIVSLFVAFTLTPMMSAKMLRVEERRTRFGQAVENFMVGMDNVYGRIVRVALRHPFITGIIAVGSFVGAIALVGLIPIEFIPAEDRGEFNVFVEMDSGTPLEETVDYVEQVTSVVRDTPGVEMTFATMGGGAQGEVNKAAVHVEMIGSKERSFSQEDAMEFVRGKLAGFDKAVIAVEPVGGIGGGGGERAGDLQYLLLGRDYDLLDQTADEMVLRLKEIPGFVDVDKSSRAGKPELQIIIDRQRAADLNVPVAVIGAAIRTLYSGDKVSEVATDGERFDARIRMQESFRDDPSKILDLSVRSSTGQLVSLSNLVRVDSGLGPTQIKRFNRSRQITVLANLRGITLGQAVDKVESIAPSILPEGQVTGEMTGSASSMKDALGYMVEAMILAVILILLILAAQFESFLHPMTILLALPLSLVGALGGLFITGMSLSMFTMIGFIMLFGLATKNAVLLVDYTNVLREEHGMETFEALVQAGIVRLRPILMTTAAMIFGMLPVALAMHEGGEARAPMAVAVIGGLITSTVLTLIVVPVAYLMLDKIIVFVTGGKKKRGDDASGDHPTSQSEQHVEAGSTV